MTDHVHRLSSYKSLMVKFCNIVLERKVFLELGAIVFVINIIFTGWVSHAMMSLNTCPINYERHIKLKHPTWSFIFFGTVTSVGSYVVPFVKEKPEDEKMIPPTMLGGFMTYFGTRALNNEDVLLAGANALMEEMFNKDQIKVERIVALQKAFECCGIRSYEDWKRPHLADHFPPNCCSDQYKESCSNPFKNGSAINTEAVEYQMGCAEAMAKQCKIIVDKFAFLFNIAIVIKILAFALSFINL